MSYKSGPVKPIPTDTPFIAPIIGLDSMMNTGSNGVPSSRSSRAEPALPPFSKVALNPPISAPALYARPLPVLTIAPTDGSAFASSMARRNSEYMVPLNALREFGLLKRISLTRPCCSTSSVSHSVILPPLNWYYPLRTGLR